MKKLLAGITSATLALGGLGVVAAAPALATAPHVTTTCDALQVYLWDTPADTVVTVTVDDEVVSSETQTGPSYWRDLPWTWSEAHAWVVDVDVPGGADADATVSGTSQPCGSDPNQHASADATCNTLSIGIDGWPAGSRIGIVVDGTPTIDQTFDSSFWYSWELDWAVSHAWSVTVDAPDDTLDRTWDGVTTPCGSDPDVYVNVSTGCGFLSVAMAGQTPGTRATVTLDGAVLDERVIDEWGWYSYYTSLADGVAHSWDVTVRTETGEVVRTDSGTVDVCWTNPATVAPEPVVALTDCGATPEDIVVPASTEAITYSLTPEGIRATATPGHRLSYEQSFAAGYRWESETSAVLALMQVLRPRCDLPGTVTAQPVCDAGQAFLEYAVDAPAGAVEEQFFIDVEGANHGYEVLWGDAGFGHPFAGRLPWQELVTNDDGTISNTWDTSVRATSVHVHFYLNVPMTYAETGTYGVMYEAEVPLTDTGNPCATSGEGDGTTDVPGHAFGRGHVGHPLLPGHPVFSQFPGEGVARSH